MVPSQGMGETVRGTHKTASQRWRRQPRRRVSPSGVSAGGWAGAPEPPSLPDSHFGWRELHFLISLRTGILQPRHGVLSAFCSCFYVFQ